MQYRKELDGLRALAVLAVIIYHAHFMIGDIHFLKGGFFGVDVFFVLSGFLITNIIRQKMNENNFSFIDFYWRRIKRIVPAMLVMLLVTSIFAYLILIPSDLLKFTDSLKTTLYFGSNYFFYNQDSYMAQASIYKPLLHTWSLAVEWQFYIIFPIIIYTINKFFKRYLFSILLALTLLSLQYANFIVINQPDAAFYLLPARAWELVFGGLGTFLKREHIERLRISPLGNIIVKALPMLGIYLILYSFFFISSKVAHPSFLTLLPVLGTFLYIVFTHKGELTHDLLSLKPIVFLGVISYSLYLWHQPVFVFFRILKDEHFRLEQFILLVIISSLLAFFSLKFIENPLRKSNKKTLISIIISIIILVGFVIYTQKTEGIAQRFGKNTMLFQNINGLQLNKINGVQCQNSLYPNNCSLNNKPGSETIILLGDSNAGAISLSIKNYAIKNNFNYIQLTSSSCTTLPNIYRHAYEHALKKGKKPNKSQLKADNICNHHADILDKVLKNNPESIIIYHVLKGTIKNSNPKKVTEKLNYLAKNSKKLNIIYPIPNGMNGIQKNILKLRSKQKITEALKNRLTFSSDYLKATKDKEYAYNAFNNVKGDNINRFYMEPYFCDDLLCYTHNDKVIYYFDKNHLSIYGAEKAMNKILPKIF